MKTASFLVLSEGCLFAQAELSGGGSPFRGTTDFGLTDPWLSIFSLPLDATGAGLLDGVTDPGSTGAARDFFRVAFP